MIIIEVKNNLVKLCYEEDLTLSGFILIKDAEKNYIAQILHLEATRAGKIAVAKLLFIYNNGIFAYDGSIPSLKSEIETFSQEAFSKFFEPQNPIILGKYLNSKSNFAVDADILKESPIILSEKFYVTKALLNNLAIQLQARKEKIIVFDTTGIFKNNKITVSKDFKLPLNNNFIDWIYKNEFSDVTDESKAIIRSVFDELSEYSKTVDFIPFNTFKSVIDAEFVRTRMFQLVILKNKIKQLGEAGIFAQEAPEYDILKTKLETLNTIVIDLSKTKSSLRFEIIKYIYSILKTTNSNYYAFTPLDNEISEKMFINDIYEAENIHTTIICDYNYEHLDELKKHSKNMIMFTPLKQQKDYGGYNVLLQKLAEDEFIAYGKMTKFVPIICRMSQISASDIFIPQTENKTNSAITVFDSSTANIPKEDIKELSDVIETETNLTNENNITEKINEIEEENIENVISTNVNNSTDIDDIIEDTTLTSKNTEESIYTNTEIENTDIKEDDFDENNITENDTNMTLEIQPDNLINADESTITGNIDTNSHDSLKKALEQVPELNEDEELSDDDLDMIESLSKPDNEIEAISPDMQNKNSQVENTQTQNDEIIKTEEANIANETYENSSEENNTNTFEDTVEEQDIQTISPPEIEETLQTRANTTPVVPEYKAEFPNEDRVNSDPIEQGDRVIHEEFGEGVVEKMINYGDKVLCSINFASVGRRLLNPDISEMRKI